MGKLITFEKGVKVKEEAIPDPVTSDDDELSKLKTRIEVLEAQAITKV